MACILAAGRRPHSARGKAVYERRVWPFCTAGSAMTWEDKREAKKTLKHAAVDGGAAGQWEQPEYLSCALPSCPPPPTL